MLQRKYEEERKFLELQMFDLEKKLEGITQELAIAKSTLAAKNSDLATLQNNLQELDELREMKEVSALYALDYLSSQFCFGFWMQCDAYIYMYPRL